jgi:hypothetical protein
MQKPRSCRAQELARTVPRKMRGGKRMLKLKLSWNRDVEPATLQESRGLLVTQSYRGIDARRTARGDIARHQRNHRK